MKYKFFSQTNDRDVKKFCFKYDAYITTIPPLLHWKSWNGDFSEYNKNNLRYLAKNKT